MSECSVCRVELVEPQLSSNGWKMLDDRRTIEAFAGSPMGEQPFCADHLPEPAGRQVDVKDWPQ